MRRNCLLLLALFVSIVTMANPVTPDEARQKISKFMNPRRAAAIDNDALRLVATSHYLERKGVLAPSYYVFNVGTSQGYVIAGADDRIPVVLGYSDRGSFDPENIPENMKAWLKGYDNQMEYLARHPEAAARASVVQGEKISPLLETEWNQDSPYNDNCPMDTVENERSVTGCVATAMAQIMYYYQWPQMTTNDIPGYTTANLKIELPGIAANTVIDWANIKPKYTGRETDEQKKAIADLMLLCGTALRMDYSATFSGASGYNAAIVLRDIFDYDAATNYMKREEFRFGEWSQMIYDELAAKRPVYYDGTSSGGGHAFIIDGYDGNDYFHVNWGWGGNSNDYFLLSILDPGTSSGIGASSSADGYSFGQAAIFGLQPNTGKVPAEFPLMATDNVELYDTIAIGRASKNDDFQFSVGFTYYNISRGTYTIDCGVGLFDANGNFIDLVADFIYGTLPPTYGFHTASNNPFSVKFGSGLANGKYFLKPIYREDGTELWYLTRNSEYHTMTCTIETDTIRLALPVFALEGTLAPSGKTEVSSSLPIKVTIANNGSPFNNEIFFLVNDKMVGGRHFNIDAGQTEEFTFSFIPQTVGKTGVSVCTRALNKDKNGYDYFPFIADSVMVNAATAYNLTINGTVENADNKNVVRENVLQLKATIKNNSATTYDNNIQVVLYKDAHDGTGQNFRSIKNYIQAVEIESGQTLDVNINFDNLEDDRYLIVIQYMSEGAWERRNNFQSGAYTIDTGSLDGIQLVTADKNSGAAYNINGQKVSKNYKGLVIRNGRKAIVK